MITGLTCVICDKTYPADFAGYVCDDHGNEGILDVVYDYARVAARLDPKVLAASQDRSIWRYLALLPYTDRH